MARAQEASATLAGRDEALRHAAAELAEARRVLALAETNVRRAEHNFTNAQGLVSDAVLALAAVVNAGEEQPA